MHSCIHRHKWGDLIGAAGEQVRQAAPAGRAPQCKSAESELFMNGEEPNNSAPLSHPAPKQASSEEHQVGR